MNIDRQIDALIDRLGGFEDRPADQGGPVKYGLRLGTLQNWLGRACGVDELQNLDRRTAGEIYYSWYYIKPGFADLPALIRPFMLDAAIICGRHCAVRFLQEALAGHGFDCGDPGEQNNDRINDRILAATAEAEDIMGDGLLVAMVARRVIYYQKAARFDPGQADQLTEQILRAEAFLPVPAKKTSFQG